MGPSAHATRLTFLRIASANGREFPNLSRIEARFILAVAAIVGIVVPWNTNLPREWWSFASNPVCSMWLVLHAVVWPPEKPSAFESTVAFSNRPPKAPLGLS
jgi:hypothetical protein